MTLSDFWTNLGWGALAFIVAPIILVLIAITIAGMKLAGVLAILYVLFLAIAGIYSTLVMGSQLLKWIKRGDDFRADWLTILIGVVTTGILGLVPYFGGIIVFAFVLAVLGQVLKSSIGFVHAQHGK